MLYLIFVLLAILYVFLSLMIAIFNCRVNYILGNISSKEDIIYNLVIAFLASPLAICYMLDGLKYLDIKHKEVEE